MLSLQLVHSSPIILSDWAGERYVTLTYHSQSLETTGLNMNCYVAYHELLRCFTLVAAPAAMTDAPQKRAMVASRLESTAPRVE